MSQGSNRRLLTVALLVATLLVALDVSVISTAMPTVVGQIGGISLYAWVFSAYLLASTISVPIYGKLSDLIGRKPVFLSSVSIFLVGSVLCGLSQSMEQLVVFRLVQGLGSGGVVPVTQTILGDVYPLAQRARMTGIFSMVWGVAALVGPAVGGFLTEFVNWRWVFYVNLPLCVLSLVLVSRFLKERVERRSASIDYLGAVLLSAAVAMLLFALESTGTIERTLGLYAVSAALFVGFVWQERRAPEPLIPLHLFSQRVIGVTTLCSALIGVSLFGQSAFVPPFVQGAMGAAPTVSGYVLAASSLTWPIASTLGGRALMRRGYRLPAMIGCALLVVGSALFAVLSPDAPLLFPALIQMIMGAGYGLVLPVSVVSAQAAVGWRQRGVVTSSNMFARTMGGTIGVSIAGAVFATGVSQAAGAGLDPNVLLTPAGRAALPAEDLAQLQSVLVASLHRVYLLFVAVTLAATAVAAFLPPGRPVNRAADQPPADEGPPDPRPVATAAAASQPDLV